MLPNANSLTSVAACFISITFIGYLPYYFFLSLHWPMWCIQFVFIVFGIAFLFILPRCRNVEFFTIFPTFTIFRVFLNFRNLLKFSDFPSIFHSHKIYFYFPSNFRIERKIGNENEIIWDESIPDWFLIHITKHNNAVWLRNRDELYPGIQPARHQSV